MYGEPEGLLQIGCLELVEDVETVYFHLCTVHFDDTKSLACRKIRAVLISGLKRL